MKAATRYHPDFFPEEFAHTYANSSVEGYRGQVIM